MRSSAPIDTATLAFRRVLADSNGGDDARVNALVVLSQRKVFAATWPGPSAMVRTLTNSDGQTALPLFTGMDSLESTATRFGWRDPDGSLQFRELGAREALQHALARGVHFVVLDIGSEHSVEFSREELETLLRVGSSSAPGPFAAAGEPRAALLDAVQRASKPPESRKPLAAASGGEGSAARKLPKRPMSHPLSDSVRPPSMKPPPVLSANDNGGRKRTPVPGMPAPPPPAGTTSKARTGGSRTGAATSAANAAGRDHTPATRDDLHRHMKALHAPRVELSDALRLGMSAALRAFPEVEWACVVADESEIPVIGVRVDPSFLNRVAEITDAILGAAEKHGMELQVLLLNNAELVKGAHKHGKAFYPWRK